MIEPGAQPDNGVALAAAALAGLGIAGLPDFVIDEHIASGALKSLLEDYPPPAGGIYVVRALIDMLVERFGGGSL